MGSTSIYVLLLLASTINANFIKNFLYNKYSKHSELGYSNARKILYSQLSDILIYGDNNSKFIRDKNCEHVWARSYCEYKEPMVSDLHTLYLSNSKLNSHRQSYKFDEVYNNYILLDNYGNKVREPSNNQLNKLYKKDCSKKIFEPPNKSKGKISRALAYFILVYPEYEKYLPHIIDIDNMIKWNIKSPVSYKEIYKNEIVRIYQGNINPYIKYPILLNLLFENNRNIICNLKLFIITIYTVFLSIYFNIIIKLKLLFI
jgi:endonuclease I